MYDYFIGEPVRVVEDRSGARRLILDVRGVGYDISLGEQVSLSDLQSEQVQSYGEKVNVPALPPNAIQVYVHYHATEQKTMLYGFLSELKREVFRLLLRVSGVGPQLAVNILFHHEATRVLVMLRDKDQAGLAEMKGLGKKTAAKLILDLAKLAEDFLLAISDRGSVESTDASREREQVMSSQIAQEDELRAALTQLGYREQEILGVLEELRRERVETDSEDNEIPLETLVSQALAILAEPTRSRPTRTS